MPSVCIACKKGPQFGHTVSHANNKGPKISLPNLQRIKINLHGRIRRAFVCTRCIRSGKVVKAA